MARNRGRPRKIPLLTVGSSVSARVVAETLEKGDEQRVFTPPFMPVDPLPLHLGSAQYSSSGVQKRLNLSSNLNMQLTGTAENHRTSPTQQPAPQDNDAETEVTTEEERPAVLETNDHWAGLFSKNRVASNGMSLTYIPPEVIEGNITVKLEKKETKAEIAKWKNALVVYVVGDVPGYNQMKRYISRVWNMVADLHIYYHNDGYYVVKFPTIDDLREILYVGPYTMSNKPLILKQWSPDFDFRKEFLTDIPIWVKFPKLPMSC